MGSDRAQPRCGAPPVAPGSSSRRRLLALLSSLPVIGMRSLEAAPERTRAAGAGAPADPMPQLFAEFCALLDRHAAALAACDRIEAGLIIRVGYPRVTLPWDADGVRRYATDAAAVTQAVPPGRGRQRLLHRLARRQHRWDTAAREAGLLEAQLREAILDGAVRTAADSVLATPAWTDHAVGLKLMVLLSVHAPGPAADATTPWRELRLILADLDRLAGEGLDR